MHFLRGLLFVVLAVAAFAEDEDIPIRSLTRVSRPEPCPEVETPEPKPGCVLVARRDLQTGCLLRFEERCSEDTSAPLISEEDLATEEGVADVEEQATPLQTGADEESGEIKDIAFEIEQTDPEEERKRPLIELIEEISAKEEILREWEGEKAKADKVLKDAVFIKPGPQPRPIATPLGAGPLGGPLAGPLPGPGPFPGRPLPVAPLRVRPAFRAHRVLPARPVLAARPAVAIQPVAITRPLLAPRPVIAPLPIAPRPRPLPALPLPLPLPAAPLPVAAPLAAAPLAAAPLAAAPLAAAPLAPIAPLARPLPFRAPPPPFPFRGPPPCPPQPRKPANSEYCTWISLKDPRGCITSFECEPTDTPKIECPRAPVKPDVGERCNWIPVMDKNNCILKYECEPIIEDPCPPAPQPPPDNDRCRWVAIKDPSNCILDYECVPLDPAPPPPLTPPFHALRDSAPFCCYWAAEGECDSNPSYMHINCAKSCAVPGCSGGFAQGPCAGFLSASGCPYTRGPFGKKK